MVTLYALATLGLLHLQCEQAGQVCQLICQMGTAVACGLKTGVDIDCSEQFHIGLMKK